MGESATITTAEGALGLRAIAGLFAEYADSLPIDLAFQGFADELAGLPGLYAGPSGALLLVRDPAGAALGCVAVRPFPARPETCEMKRLFLRPAGRGRGLGRVLAEAALGFAGGAGYREIVLDTLPSMTAAIRLYRSLGFEPAAAYGPESPETLLYFRRRLAPP